MTRDSYFLATSMESVVVTLSFNAKIDLANFECNRKTRDSQKWPRKGPVIIYDRGGIGFK